MFSLVNTFTDLVTSISESLINSLSTVADFVSFLFSGMTDMFKIFSTMPQPFNSMCFTVVTLILAILIFKIVQLIKIW